MIVLVIGGAGYIGRHVCRALQETAFAIPAVFDLNINGEVYQNFAADLTDPQRLANALDAYRPKAIIHLAAHSDVAESVRDPAKYRENVLMAAILAEKAAGIPTVFASSAAVYGDAGAAWLDEDAPLAPINPYGQSKVDCEALLPDAISLRLFNVVGGDGDEGAHLVPKVLKALAGRGAFMLNGDGSCIRDFVDVEDVAQAFVLALKAKLKGAPGQSLNVCTGIGRSVTRVIAACEHAAGLRLPGPPPATPRPGDAARLVGGNARAREVIGWTPTRSLDASIASARAAIREEAVAWA